MIFVMKKILFFILFSILFTPVFCQNYFNYSKLINGYWGEWISSNPYTYIDGGYLMKGTYDEFIIYEYGKHPSQYVLKVKLFHMAVDPNKKRKKKRVKSNEWYEYQGSVEYFTVNEQEKLESIIHKWPYTPDASVGKSHTVPATIKIQPYKKYPEVYNIFFEDNGLGIHIL